MTFTVTGPADEAMVLTLMREFYEIENLPYDREIASRALNELWTNPSLGQVMLMRVEGEAVGYLVLTFGFSLEFHGRDALVDEFYVREVHRGRGLGTACLERVEEICRVEGVRAVHLEVDYTNPRAKKLYDRAGYRDHDRRLLTKWL